MTRRVIFAAMILFIFSGSVSAMDIWIQAKEGDYNLPRDTVDLGIRYRFSLYYNNNDFDRTIWVTPFRFYGTGTLSQVAYQAAQDWGSPIESYCTSGLAFNTEGWGDGVLPDQHCISCNGLIPAEDQDVLFFHYYFGFTGDLTTTGEFCIETGDFPGTEWDWLFQSPVPTFETQCYPLKVTIPATVCGDINCDGSVNILDIIAYIAYLWDGPPPCDWRAADVDGNFSHNIMDITRLIDFLYQGGPELTCGFEW